MNSKKIYFKKITNSFEETKMLGYWLGKELFYQQEKKIILLQGPLGCGKTSFTKGFIKSFGINQTVCSPTFVIMKTYYSPQHTIYHLDLYRASLEEEFLEELLEDLTNKELAIVEFVKDYSHYFPYFNFLVQIVFLNQKQRKITISQNIIPKNN